MPVQLVLAKIRRGVDFVRVRADAGIVDDGAKGDKAASQVPLGDGATGRPLQSIGYGNLRVSEDDKKSVDREQPDLGFYPPDKRLVGTQKTDALRKEKDAHSKARAKSFAKVQAIAAIEENLKKLRENTDEKLEREALDKIEKAVLWYKDAKFFTELLSVDLQDNSKLDMNELLKGIEKETVPFPTDKKQGVKKK